MWLVRCQHTFAYTVCLKHLTDTDVYTVLLNLYPTLSLYLPVMAHSVKSVLWSIMESLVYSFEPDIPAFSQPHDLLWNLQSRLSTTSNSPTHIRTHNVPVMRGHGSSVYLSGPVTALFSSTRAFDQTGMMDGIISARIHRRKYLIPELAYLKWRQAPVWLNLMSTPSLSLSRDFILIALPWNTTHTFWRIFFRKQI